MLTRSTRPVRDGVLLALLVTAQAFINEEILLFTALACGVFLLAVLAQRPGLWSAAWRPLATGLAVCAVLAGALLAYPLYVQFAGPMAYHGLSDAVRDYGNDIAAFFAPGSPTLGGNERANVNLAPNYSEENAFFGWSLSLLAVGIVVWLRREVVVRALAATGLFFAVLSLGERVSWWDRDLGHRPVGAAGPAAAARRGGAHPVRPDHHRGDRGAAGAGRRAVLVAADGRAADRADADRRRPGPGAAADRADAVEGHLPAAGAAASSPPTAGASTSARTRPWCRCPCPAWATPTAMRWAASTNLDFKIPGGYFLAPRNGNTGDPGRFGGRPSGIGELLEEVATTGRTPKLDDRQRRRCLDELRHWRAAVVVLPLDQQNAEPLRRTVEQLVGPGRQELDVWLWDVRTLTDRSA